MESGNVGSMNCVTCGNPVTPVRSEWIENGWSGKCPRCAKVDDLIEELIRKQLRDSTSPRFTAMAPSGWI